ncbi:MAG: SNF1-interacting protein [Pycnora praestabilis]|nr:MAG: SNF1-interacting protein [Pycnora praestabilis]
MGNSATKEARPPASQSNSFRHSRSNSQPTNNAAGSSSAPAERLASPVYSARNGRGSRPDISSLLGIGSSGDREAHERELRRETKPEREARRAERERVAREAERERSMKEEGVDGGYLVTQGVYTGTEDYNKAVVRQLMVCSTLTLVFQNSSLTVWQIERRIAPFWKGLNDHSDAWTEHQLVAAANGLPIPAADEIPPEDPSRPSPTVRGNQNPSDQNLHSLMVPMTSRSQSYNSDTSINLSPSHPAFSLPPPSSPFASPTNPSPFRPRSKTLASLTSSKNIVQADMTPREVHLPRDLYVNGQRLEAYLYKDAAECPICFLYYPPYLNKTRCCDQSICSECFVQIKRPDPHPPEHSDPNSPSASHPVEPRKPEEDESLVSEPAQCPFCVQPEFGISYEPPPFRRGITYANQISNHPLANAASAMSSSSSLVSLPSNAMAFSAMNTAPRRRAESLSVDAPNVITTDRIRPDWATKLAGARAHAARRSAAATALHTAAYLMGNGGDRNYGGFGRRGGLMRRIGSGDASFSGGSSSAQAVIDSTQLATFAGRHGITGRRLDMSSYVEGMESSGRRRSRVDDLEDMMMMEAIRLSLATEEEDRKRKEKEAKKEAKKKGKENKKAKKVAKKNGLYASSANGSTSGVESPLGPPGVDSGRSSVFGDNNTLPGKGKNIDRGGPSTSSTSSINLPLKKITNEPSSSSSPQPLIDLTESPQDHLERSRAQLPLGDGLVIPQPVSSEPQHLPLEPQKPSHLRQVSNTSSSASSFVESAPGSMRNEFEGSSSSFYASPSASGLNVDGKSHRDSTGSATPPAGGAGTEPMFNFRSLAAMIGHEEKNEVVAHSEHTEHSGNFVPGNYIPGHRRGESSSKATRRADSIDLDQSIATIKANPFDDPPEGSDYADAPEFIITSSSGSDLVNPGMGDKKHSDGIKVIDAGSHQQYSEGAT